MLMLAKGLWEVRSGSADSHSDEAPPTSRITWQQSFRRSSAHLKDHVVTVIHSFQAVLVWKVCEQVLVSPQTGAESPRQQGRAAAASLPVSPFSLNGK